MWHTHYVYKSKLEAAFANYLQGELYRKAIQQWWYEPMLVHLAPKTTYTPDFLVQAENGLTIYEVKGFRRDDAMVKLKVAAKMFPCFRWHLVTRQKREWIFKKIANG